MKMIAQALIAGLVLSTAAFAETKEASAPAAKVAVANAEVTKKAGVKHHKMVKAAKAEKAETTAPATK